MADSAAGIDRGIDTPAYSPYIGGERPNGDRPLKAVPRMGDAVDPREGELAGLIRTAVARLESGAESEAIDCFRKALELGDKALGAGNPDLVLILNDLTRLYLKQSRYADAEPLLLRLLDIKRSKGEDHPEVGTVLASLAAVQHALGRHESAEQLWRRVLEIRERTLAPNHFAIATALEHLGDACAARGNIGEALPAFQRALIIRERTLGDAHPSVRTCRERIGDLQLQAAEDSLDASTGPALLGSPERYRLLAGEQVRFTSPLPLMRELPSPQAKESAAPAPREATRPAPVATRQMKVVMQIPVAETTTPDAPAEKAEAQMAAPGLAAAVPLRDALESIRDEVEGSHPRAPLGERMAPMLDALTQFFSRRQVVAAGVAVVMALLLLAVARDHAWGDFEQTSAAAETAKQPAGQTPPLNAGALATQLRQPPIIAASTTALKPAPAKAVAQKSRSEERAPSRRVDDSPRPDDKKFAVPAISTSMISHLDSVVSKAGVAPREDVFSVQPTAIAFGNQHPTFGSTNESAAPMRARLVGELPTPLIPPQASDVEGVVRVRFTVDAQGQPLMS
ncbi:MAG TPA: tetratricopeptide repeat protein, partial [Gemmatimonadaceae bacterium]